MWVVLPLQPNGTAQSPDRGFRTAADPRCHIYGRRQGAPREHAANGCGQYVWSRPESSGKGIGKKLFDICRAACCECSTTPRAIMIIISSRLPRPDACCRLKNKTHLFPVLFSLNLHPLVNSHFSPPNNVQQSVFSLRLPQMKLNQGKRSAASLSVQCK